MGNLRLVEDVRGTADAWFARLRAPECSAAERALFEAWCDADPRHAEAYADTEELWRRLGALSEAPELMTLEREAVHALREAPEQETWRANSNVATALPASRYNTMARRRSAWATSLGLAAAAMLALALGMWFFVPSLTDAPPLVYVATDQLRNITLSDGSELQLDVGTRVSAQLSSESRLIELKGGRAIFAVAHDAGRPFIVVAADSRVTAIGTRFQVQSENKRVTVTLAEGVVAVQRGATTGRASQQTRLQPGEQVSYTSEQAVWDQRKVDADAATSWSQGRLVFHGAPLIEAVAEVNRYSLRKIHLADPELAALRLSGTFRTGDASVVATVLPAVLPVRVEAGPSGELLLHAR